MAQQTLLGQDLLIIEASRPHSDTPHSSGRVISPTQRTLPDNIRYSQQTDIHAPGGIRIRNPSKRTAADPRLKPRGHWDRQMWHIRTALKEYKPSSITFTATCFDFCGKPSSGNVKNTHRNIIYTLPIGMTLFHTPQMSSIQKTGAISADTGRSSRVSYIWRNVQYIALSCIATRKFCSIKISSDRNNFVFSAEY